MRPPSPWISFLILILAGALSLALGNVLGIFLVLSGAVTVLILEGVLVFARVQMAGQDFTSKFDPGVGEQVAQSTLDLVRWMELPLALSFAFGVIFGGGQPGGVHPAFAIVTILAIVGWGWVGSMRLINVVRKLKAEGKTRGLKGWNGLTYSNPQDPRIWVPKIGGVGYTLNFAHRKSWWLAALMTLPPLALALVGLLWRSV